MNRNLKCYIVFLSFFIYHLSFSPIGAYAKPDFGQGKRYHIVCQQFPQGCVTDGATAGQQTPIYYLPTATTNDETYWIFDEVNPEEYAIRNAKTGLYITYDGVREDISQGGQLRRYVSMTAQMDDRYSLWTFSQQADGIYVVRNIGQADHVWDVRVDSYCLGTYSKTSGYGNNQLFTVYDPEGNRVVEKQETPVTEDGYNVSSWLVATTESPDGWTFNSGTWSDPGFGNYRNGTVSVVSPFLERWQDSSRGPLPNSSLSQTLQNLPAGQYLLAADIIAVRQSSNNGWYGVSEEVGYGVYLFANNSKTEAGTRNERPQHYSVGFSIGTNDTITLGVSIDNTNANWVATDNFYLYFQGTEDELIAGEKEKVRKELADYYSSSEIEDLIAQCNDNFDALEQLRHSTDYMPATDPIGKGLKDLTINGRGVAWAESIGLYLHSLPEEFINDSYPSTISYTPKEGCSNLRINDKEIAPGTQYTFSTLRPGSSVTLSVTLSDGTRVSTPLAFTSLPVVKLYGSFNNNYSEGLVQVFEPDMDSIADLLSMKAKWRGGITNNSDKHKRNYHVKLKDANGDKLEKKFFGLRNDNSWILEACQVDMSRIRNRVLTDLWNDYSTPPYYIAQEKKAMTGTRGQFVELILNDEYRGIYCMTENMDRKQLKLMKYDDEAGITHGQLWKSKDWSYAVFMGHNSNSDYYPGTSPVGFNNNSESWDQYYVKYPDFEDYNYQTDWQVLYKAVDFVCTSSDTDFARFAENYFDLPLLIDYYILMETILSTDNHGKNMFFACYDKQKDSKITFAVWDMDATCGQRWSDEYFHQSFLGPEQDYAQFITQYEHGDYNLFRRFRNTNAGDFNEKVRLRYRDLRDGFLATESILQRFRDYFEHFRLAGADEREYAKWNYDSDIAGRTLDFENEMEYLTDWFTRRMNYLDTKRFDIGSLPPSAITPTTLSSGHQQPVYNLNGIQVGTADQLQQLPAGIYIVNGKKIVTSK